MNFCFTKWRFQTRCQMSEGFPSDVGRYRPSNRSARLPFWTGTVQYWILELRGSLLRDDLGAGWNCDRASLNIPFSVGPLRISLTRSEFSINCVQDDILRRMRSFVPTGLGLAAPLLSLR